MLKFLVEDERDETYIANANRAFHTHTKLLDSLVSNVLQVSKSKFFVQSLQDVSLRQSASNLFRLVYI